jgi:acyl-CoA thioesterase FadM
MNPVLASSSVSIRTSLILQSADVDGGGLLTSSRLQTILQMVSDRHSDLLGCGWVAMHQEGYYWVISRIRVRIDRRPRLGEKLTIETWVNPAGAAGVDRNYRIFDEKHQILVEAMAKWSIVALDSHRLIRSVGFALLDQTLPYRTEKVFPDGFGRLVFASSESDPIVPRKIIACDIDANGHVNNTRFIAFVEDAARFVYGSNLSSNQFLIHYLAPLYADETVFVSLHKEAQGVAAEGTVVQSGVHVRAFLAQLN